MEMFPTESLIHTDRAFYFEVIIIDQLGKNNEMIIYPLFQISLSLTHFLQLSKLTVDHAEIWYFRVLKKEEAQAKCSNVGDYLVRYDPEYENYILTVKLKSGILHSIPIQDIAGDVSFLSFVCLILMTLLMLNSLQTRHFLC